MSITTTARLKSRLGISQANATEDIELAVLIEQIEAALERSLGRKLAQGIYTQVLDGSGDRWLTLANPPVTAFGLACLSTSGSPLLTIPSDGAGADAASLLVGMPAWSATGLPDGTSVTGIDPDGATVTLSANATVASSTLWVVFGIDVREDSTSRAAGGLAEAYFSADSILAPGIDYMPRLDDSDDPRRSASGLLERLTSVWPRNRSRQVGALSSLYAGPLPGRGNIKVTYCGGYATIPPDIELAVMEAAALARSMAHDGRTLNSESWQGYSYSMSPLLAESAWLGYFGGPGARTLARYRRMPV